MTIIEESISYDYYKYNIIKKSQSFYGLNYEYLGATADDMKYQKCWFINSNKLDFIKNKKQLYKIDTEKQHLYLEELFFSIDEAVYSCPFKSIKIKNSIKNNFGIISKTLSNIIQKECKIHSFTSVFGILNGFMGNFSLRDSDYINAKKRILIGNKKTIQQRGDENENDNDNKFYILKIFKYKKGIIDNESIEALNYFKDTFINEYVKNSLYLNIRNIYNKVPVEKLQNFLEDIREDIIIDIHNNKGHKLLANNLLFDIKRELNEYQYYLLMNNELEIPNSAILGGIIDHYGIMDNYKNSILVIIDNETNKNEFIKGKGIIFKTRTNYVNSKNYICQIQFFDIERYEKINQDNNDKVEKIKKIKTLKNVIIFSKNSSELFEELSVDDISQQEFFISWNKNLDLQNKKRPNEEGEISENDNNEKAVSYNELKKSFIKNKYREKKINVEYIRKLHRLAKKEYRNNIEMFSIKKQNNNHIKIDYKNLTKKLMNNNNEHLSELELFYLEYIPRCTKEIIKIINVLKELMYKYSSNNFAQFLII